MEWKATDESVRALSNVATTNQHLHHRLYDLLFFIYPDYQYGIQLTQRVDNHVLITFNARNDHDRSKFVEDIRESIMEMIEMENIRIEAELERQKGGRLNR